MNEQKTLKKKLYGLIILPIALALVFLFVCITAFGINSKEGIIGIVVIFLYIILVVISYVRLKPLINSTLVNYSLEQGKIQKELLKDLAIPYAILDVHGKIMWANRMFNQTVGVSDNKRIRKSIDTYFPELTPSVFESAEQTNRDIEYGGKFYNAMIKRVNLSQVFEENETEEKGDDVVIAMYLFDVTDLKHYIQENADQKLVAGLVYIDNYDEVMDSLEEVKHPVLTALVDRKINMYLNNIDAISKKLENDKYFFVFRQKFMQTLKDDKFSLLDDAKNINVGNEIRITLSMGIGAGSDSFVESFENAKVAIGLALGRGGDQAAVKYGEQVSYFGGKSAGTEKATRVKARVKAHAFEEMLENKEKVIIMGHKRPDADAFGSAVGIYRLVATLGKKAYIVINEVTSAIKPVINSFKGSNIYGDLIVTSEQAINLVDANTLLVVVDVNRPSITECEELLSMVNTVVVFDHHRQSNEVIPNATLSYIEPFASSACEMVAEILQYINIKPKIRPVEADAMYAGILIDTDNFLTKTGVRTFEAAAYLRKCGADVTRVRKMFRSNIEELKERAQGINNAETFMDIFALSYVTPDDATDAPTVVAAKVANELLNVEGIKASFVVTEVDGILYVSARSVDDINVQVIMEKFDGGGHANMAGVQLKGKPKETFFNELKETLSTMYAEGEI